MFYFVKRTEKLWVHFNAPIAQRGMFLLRKNKNLDFKQIFFEALFIK